MSERASSATDIIKRRPLAAGNAGMPIAPAPAKFAGIDLRLDPAPPRAARKASTKIRLVLFCTAAIVLVAGMLLSLGALRDRQAVIHHASAAGGAPSTTKPSPAAVAGYSVAPDRPRYLNIPELDVHARIFPLGTLSDGALATPDNVFDTGWYDESSLPGQPGAMLIDGHVSSWTTNGVFYGLKNLRPGDKLAVVRGDGKTFNYQVVRSQVFPADHVDMKAAMTPVVSGSPGLNLITCTGKVKPGTSEFDKRVIVFTQQI